MVFSPLVIYKIASQQITICEYPQNRGIFCFRKQNAKQIRYFYWFYGKC